MEEVQSEARTALEEALRKAKAEGPRCSTPQDRMAAASARVTRLKAALQLLGEDTPDAAPLKVALEQARGQARLRPVGERVDSCLQFIERVKKQIVKPRTENDNSKKAWFSRRTSWRKVCGIWRFCGPRPTRSRRASQRSACRDSPMRIPQFRRWTRRFLPK